MQELSWLLGHKMQRVPVLFEASSEEALCPKSLSVPRRSQMSLLCLNLYPESHQDLLHTEQSICIIYDITFWFQSVENFINFFQSENSCINE